MTLHVFDVYRYRDDQRRKTTRVTIITYGNYRITAEREHIINYRISRYSNYYKRTSYFFCFVFYRPFRRLTRSDDRRRRRRQMVIRATPPRSLRASTRDLLGWNRALRTRIIHQTHYNIVVNTV